MNLTAAEILAVPLNAPSRLFKGDGHAVYRQLMKRWHPDRGADKAPEVAAHINALYAKYEAKEQQVFVVNHDKEFNFHYLYEHELPNGTLYVGSNTIVQKFRDYDIFMRAWQGSNSANHRFANTAMKQEHARYLGAADGQISVAGHHGLLFSKPEGYFSIAQIMRKYPTLPPEHVAWILSSLYNVNSYLSWAKTTYGGLTPMTYFISPEQHNGILFGGWGSSTAIGFKPVAIPSQLVGLGDYTTKQFDSACIRKLGRDMLGADLHKAPMPLQLWLSRPGRSDSYAEYKDWEQVLTDSFGKRKYVKLDFNASDL